MHTRTVIATTLILLTVFFYCYGDAVQGVLRPAVESDARRIRKLDVYVPTNDGARKAAVVINYTAIGDSITAGVGASSTSNSFVARLAQFIANDMGTTVNVDNRGVSGTTSAQLLSAIQTDAAMRASLQNAQFITFNAGSNDFLLARNSYRATTCGGVDNQDCLRAAIAQFKTNWNAIIAEILALRANTGVEVRTFDLYYPFVQLDLNTDTFPGDGGLNDFQVLNFYLDDADDHIRTTAAANAIALGRVHRSFNGTDGTNDPAIFYSIIAGDGFHPNDLGHSVIADRLRSGQPICLQSPNGLQSWYRAENNANDSTTNNNHATLENGTTFVAGKDGQAFSFDGVDDSVLVPSIDLGDLYTIEMWINPAPTQDDTFVHIASNDAGASVNYGEFGLFTNTPGTPGNYSLKYRQNNSDRVATAAVIMPGVWTHIALTHGPETRIYVNGVLAGASGVLFTATYENQVRLGHRIDGVVTFYNGGMDEVSFYNRALSAAEIGTIVDADSAGKCTGVTTLQIAPTSANVNAGASQQFTVTGGVSPYVFSISNNPPQHGTIDPATGQYIGNSAGVDTVRVTDAELSISQATVTVTGNDTVCPSGQKVWDGGGSTNNWNDAGNWCGNSVPASSSNIVFDATSVKNATVNVNSSANKINIAAGYTGTITVATGITLTMTGGGGQNSGQAGGTFTIGAGNLSINNTFILDGGVFNSGTGNVNIGATVTINGGTFNSPSVVNSGNVALTTTFADLVINNGGTFNAPGTLTLSHGLIYNGGSFNHRNGTVVFVGSTNVFVTIGPSEILFNNLTLSKGDGTADVIISGDSRVARVLGTLTLTEGSIGVNANSIGLRAEGPVNISAGFGEPTSSTPGGIGILQLQDGPAARVVSIPAGAALPRLVINDPNVTVNTVGTGTVLIARLTLQRGAVNVPAANLTVGIGSVGGFCYDQSGGTFTNGSGNFLCQFAFQLTQPDGANPSIFNGGAGTFTLNSVGSTFVISGGTFNAPAGGMLVNTGVSNNVFTQSGGTFNGGTGPFTCACAQFGLSSGTFNASTGTSTFERVFNRTGGTFNPNGGTVVFTATPGGSMAGNATTFHNLTIAFSGNNHQVFATTTGTLLLQSGIVDNNGTTFNAEGNVQIESGFGGSTGTVTFSGTGTQTYTNNGGVPPTGIWTVNKPSGTLNLNTDLDISNGTTNFNLTSGIINAGANVVALGTRPVSGGGTAAHVIGNLRRTFPAGSTSVSLKYDVGTASGYAPVTIVSPGRAALTALKVSTVGMPHPLFDPARSLNFYWKIDEGSGLTNTGLTFVYPQAAVNGNEADYRVDRVENGQIQILPDPITISTNTVTLSGINISTADWTMSELPPPLVLSGPAQPIVNPTDTIRYTASGGRPDYVFSIPVNNSGATLSSGPSSTFYTAGPTAGVTDTLRLRDSLGTIKEVTITVVSPFVVINTNEAGGGSLSKAIENANATPGAQTITFNLPGPPPYTIAPVSNAFQRFDITDPIIIDGTTQPGFAGSPIIEVKKTEVRLFASNSAVKGLVINGASGAFSSGLLIGANTTGNVIQGNYIGTDVSGNIAVPNSIGIRINGDANLIGGTTPATRNVIAGNQIYGIYIERGAGTAVNNIVKGNFIGVGADGTTPVGNGESGIRLESAQDTIIGGTAAGEGNLIANNQASGVSTFTYAAGLTRENAIRGNSIFANAGLGIDLRPVGVNANDACDADTGDQNRQNFPDLTFVSSFGGNTNIQGTLNGEASKTFTLDFYSNTTADDPGFGEGQTYLGSGQVTTSAGCGSPTTFDITLPVPLPSGNVVTATATDPDGNTSEFSAFLGVQPADIAGTILNSGGQPVKGAAVRLRRVGSTRIMQTVSTDRLGKYKFANLPLGLNYEVQPVLNNFVFIPAVRTYPTFTTTQNDSYTAVANNFSIGGRITMGAFSLSGATVTLSGAANATTTTDSSGDYIFNNLPSGTYAVSATKANVIFAPPSIDFPTPITSNKTANFDGVSVLSTLPGRIVFRDGEGNIKSMNPDSSGLVTLIPRNTAYTYFLPRISRDGSKMVLNADCLSCPSSIPNEVRTSSIDGSVLSPSLAPGTSCFKSTFSPNASKIACQSSDTFGEPIITINSNGTGFPFALTSIGVNRDPDWSPDGTKIIYAKQISNGPAIIFRVNSSGGGETPLIFLGTSDGSAAPRWSPDASRILFSKRFGNGGLSEIDATDAQGVNQVMIANSSSALTFPAWSPDGSYAAFTKCGSGGCELRTTRVDVQDQLVIASNFPGLRFDWGPDNNIATPPGTNTRVDSGRVQITFPSTSSPGATTITPIDPAAAGNVPGGFVVDGVAFEISTTATFTPPVEVCVTLTLIEPTVAQFNAYTFMHNENGVMVDRTSLRDFPSRRICGLLPSFSPVALMKQIDPALPAISGLVLDSNGNPMNDVQVSISDDETPVKTDFNGHFEFVNLKPGADYMVQAFKGGHLFAPPYQTFFNLTGNQTAVFTATSANFDISGTVVDGANEPVSGITMRLTGDSESEVVTNADGAFTFAGLAANGTYTVAPLQDGNIYSAPEVSIDALQSNLAGLVFTRLTPTAAGVSISGRITTKDGIGIGRARLTLTSRTGETLTAVTGPFGYFRFDDIQAGETYFLEVVHKRYQFAGSPRVLTVRDELTDVDFIGSTPDEAQSVPILLTP